MRDVPAPPDLQSRLRGIAIRDLLTSDAALDEQLRTVAVPDGLALSIGRGLLAEDDWLDAAVADVPVPARLEGRIICWCYATMTMRSTKGCAACRRWSVALLHRHGRGWSQTCFAMRPWPCCLSPFWAH